MNTGFEYYYNNVPGKGLCRNNLIYTSLISKDRKTFCKWYYNDQGYHGGHNQVVDPNLMEEKWNREIKFYTIMEKHYPEHVLELTDIDHNNKKLYFKIENVDFWELAGCDKNNFNKVLPNWQEQLKEIFTAHRKLGIFKYSLHPSSYFIVNNKLKSINYFFSYNNEDTPISLFSVLSHISEGRRKVLFPQMEKMGIDLYNPTPFEDIQRLAYKSFADDYPEGFADGVL
jgi:hypothetical protein